MKNRDKFPVTGSQVKQNRLVKVRRKKRVEPTTKRETADSERELTDAEKYLIERGVSRQSWKKAGVEFYESEIHTPWERLALGKDRRQQIRNHCNRSIWVPCFGPNGSAEEPAWIVRPPSSLATLNKFLVAHGKRAPVWIAPETYAVAKDVSKPITLTEGPVKGMVLAQAGAYSIAINGVWGAAEPKAAANLIAPVDEQEWDEGKKDESGAPQVEEACENRLRLRDELARFKWYGRTVYLAYDADQAINRDVCQAAIRIWMLLSLAGATIKQLEWDRSENKKGIDDYLASVAGSDPDRQKAAFEELCAAAKGFLETMQSGPGGDAELVRRELGKCHMGPADRSAFAKQAAGKLKVAPSTLLPHWKETINQSAGSDSGLVSPRTHLAAMKSNRLRYCAKSGRSFPGLYG
jgi:Domain of unknown function (DUF3854)